MAVLVRFNNHFDTRQRKTKTMIPEQVETNAIQPGTSAQGGAGWDTGAAGYSSDGNQNGEPPTECGITAYSDHGAKA
jgi:hypothetical protein